MNWPPERIAAVRERLSYKGYWYQDDEQSTKADIAALARIGLAVVEAKSETVERVARAIQQVAEQNGAAPFDALPLIHKHAQEDLRDTARAVLAALADVG